MRDEILTAIREIATENGGQVPGSRSFERITGIRQSAWRGIYWARWGEAVREAGLEPNEKQGALSEDFILRKLADACRQLGKVPTAMEMRMYARTDPDFPNSKTITSRFGSLRNFPDRLSQWVKANADYSDLAGLFTSPEQASSASTPVREGLVYLIKSGAYYKIGRSDELERRVKQIRIALPDAASLIHSIRTDDPSGIEAYWHRRFADRRANGEWFELTAADVTAFKRRKYQ